jgi:histidinol-phosphatase (PHP family)
MIDVHIHTRHSFDSSELPQNYINAAISNGVPTIGFSEHYDYDAFLDGADITLCDLDAYVADINSLRKTNTNTDILCGIEFGYTGIAVPTYKKLTQNYPFDYVINSVHTLPARGDSYFPSFFTGRTIRQSYIDYFNAVLASVKADYDFQIIGHIGYVSRYCKGENSKINYKDYAEIFDEILKEIINRGKCLEINTSSGEEGSDFLPDKDVIERYLQLGGNKLSFASDAHKSCDYLRKSQLVKSYLTSIGIKQLCYFKSRNCIYYDI